MCKPLAGHIEDPLDWRASSFDPLAPIVRTEFNGHWSGFSTCQHQSLDFQGFLPTSIKNLENWCFLPITLSGPLSKQTVIICGLCLVGFDPGLCVFLGSLLSSLSRFGRVFLKVLPQL